MIYYKFIEDNDWEGERWCFYFPENPEVFNRILEILATWPEDWGECPYYLSDKEYTEEQVDTLVENTCSGYMDYHNKCKVPELPESVDWKEDPFYKGGIWRDNV